MQDTVTARMELLMKELLTADPAPDKKTRQMDWVRHMNALKAQAEEIGLFDVQLRDPTLAYPIFRAESKEHLESMLWADVRNNRFLPDAKIVTATPNYDVTVTAEEAPVLETWMDGAGISMAQFVHGNGDVTFSFAESDRHR